MREPGDDQRVVDAAGAQMLADFFARRGLDADHLALARSQQLLTEGTNLAWLVGPDGHMAWSLRMDEDSAVAI